MHPRFPYALLLLAGLVLVATGPAAADGPRPWRAAPVLAVNLSHDHRLVSELSREKGEAQLGALCATAAYEEMWAFAPGQNLWIEVGCCERATAGGTYVSLEQYVDVLVARFDRLDLYHIHPRSRFKAETFDDRRRLIETVAEALPSAADMRVMVMVSREFRAAHPQGEMNWYIRSRHGVTTYGLTPAGWAMQGKPEVSRFNFDPLDPDEDLADHPALAEADTGGPATNKLIAQACRRLSGGPFIVRFRPVP